MLFRSEVLKGIIPKLPLLKFVQAPGDISTKKLGLLVKIGLLDASILKPVIPLAMILKALLLDCMVAPAISIAILAS